jgi:hypothetical protein
MLSYLDFAFWAVSGLNEAEQAKFARLWQAGSLSIAPAYQPPSSACPGAGRRGRKRP